MSLIAMSLISMPLTEFSKFVNFTSVTSCQFPAQYKLIVKVAATFFYKLKRTYFLIKLSMWCDKGSKREEYDQICH